jgi:uncharacterized protein
MKMTLENLSSLQVVRGYRDGEILIGETRVTSTCLVAAQTLQVDLRPRTPADLGLVDLEPLFALTPEVAIVGWAGGQFLMPPRQRRWFLERRIGIEVMELGAACRTYNVLVQDGRPVAGLLFPHRD